MAILEDVPGLEVEVHCNNRALPEYDDPNANDRDDAGAAPSSMQYIECVDNASFEVHIIVNADYEWGYRNHVLVANTYVDGDRIRGSVIRQSEGLVRRCIKGNEHRDAMGQWALRKFQFSSVKTVDDGRKERVEKDMGVAQKLGTIEVRFERAIEYGLIGAGRTKDRNAAGFELSEKSLKGKAISHGTSYGAAEPIFTPSFVDARNLGEDGGPIAVFQFRYQSREALKRELIIPRSPSRSPTLEDLTPEEVQRLARERFNQLRNPALKQEEARKIKRERGETLDLTGNPAPPVIRPTKKSRLTDGRVVDAIDLTDD
ncbi:hypothetical protein GGR57DRAFT_110433 [Xylariaceae sp. FL1272]|nr:hypothetical protein GGR57DRAFT_110433 [Xylariaceae sp. FL1272]